jgi:hypothetical protein
MNNNYNNHIYLEQAIGHLRKHGGGDLSSFGIDFDRNGFRWNESLCRKDSDNDGLV